MSSLFGIEASRATQFAIAFAIILVLVALFGLVLRKLTGARLIMPGNNDRGRSRQPRLGVVDIYDLDRQRQLVLLRRDNVEHLLLIGGLNDVVIETNIVRVAGARLPAANEAERFEPALDQPARPPQVEPSGRPSIETQLAAQLGAFVRRPAEDSDIEQELSPVASVSAPVPARPEPVLKPDAVTVSSAPAVQGLRAEARSSGPVSAPAVREPIVERPEPRPAFPPSPSLQSRPTPTTPVSPAPPVQAPSARPVPPVQPEPARPPQPAPIDRQPPVERPAASPGPDAAVLSDMAKQLEEALKRPASPVAPPAAPLAGAPHAPVREEIADEDDLLEPGPSGDEAKAPRETFKNEEAVEEPAPARAPEPPRAAEPVRPAPPPPAPAQPVTPPARAPEASAAPEAAPKAPDPFSVEEIEAEFARLLGRPLDPNKKG